MQSKQGSIRSVRSQSIGPMNLLNWFFAGAIGGLVGMYFMDPRSGNRRRAFIRDKTNRFERLMLQFFDKRSRDLYNRVYGTVLETRGRFVNVESVDDDILIERVRSKIGRVVSHPKLVGIEAHDGHIRLMGVALRNEIPHIYAAAKTVRGVHGVTNAIQAAHGEREIAASASARGANPPRTSENR